MFKTKMSEQRRRHRYSYEELPSETSFRVIKLLPVACILHLTDWSNPPDYEALSYAWGDPYKRADIICDGKILQATRSLYAALTCLR